MIVYYHRPCLGDEVLGDRDILAGFLPITGLFDAAKGRLGGG